MDSNNGNSYTPNLRFPGFDEEWVEKNMEELCKPITPSFKLQSRDYLKAGKYPIVDQSQSLICGWTNDDKGLVKNVPVIVFGDHTCVLKYIDFPFIQGADGVKILSPKKDYDSRFVFQSFLANPVKPDGYKRHFSDFKEKTYLVPSPAEQKKIASCLSEMDNLISAQSQKVESLKSHKKGLMQQLFPQPGETTPQLRFSGFTGEWEEKKLGEVFVPLVNSTLSRADLNNQTGKAMYVHYGDILIKFGDVLDVINVRLPFITDDTLAERACKSILKDGDVIVADTAEDETAGKCTEIRNIGEIPVVSGLHTIPLRPSIRFAAGFMGYYLNSESYRNGLYPLMQGVKVTSISKSALIGTNIQFPSNFAEQQKIASCLLELDKNIEAESMKLDSLKDHKKGLMQQLFPEPIK